MGVVRPDSADSAGYTFLPINLLGVLYLAMASRIKRPASSPLTRKLRPKKQFHANDSFLVQSACEKVTELHRFLNEDIIQYESSKKKEKTMKIRTLIASLPIVALTLAGANQASAQGVTQNAPSGVVAAPQPQPFHRPLVFEPNRGQAPAEVQWIARASGYQLYLTSEGVTMLLPDRINDAPPSTLIPAMFQPPRPYANSGKTSYSTVKMKLTGSRPWQAVAGLEPTGGISNYFFGSDPQGWHTGIPHYAKLKAAGVYEGIDLVFYSHGGELEYDFVVAPGADPQQIRLAFEGVDRTRIDGDTGNLLLTTAGGREIRHIRPQVYQQAGDRKIQVAAGYEILDRQQAAFTLASYDRQRALVIDPTISFTTFLAGNNQDSASAVAVDSAGNAYVTGFTVSTNFPIAGALQNTVHGSDAFVTKLSSTGAILFSTYWGGSSVDYGTGIAVDSTGVYIVGTTASSDFPGLRRMPFVPGYYDAFVTKFSSTGNAMVYSLVVGGSGNDQGNAIAVDASHAAYITGMTTSSDFPIAGTWHTQLASVGYYDAFVAKVAPTGAGVVASAYLGGSQSDWATGIAIDPSGSAWITGVSCSNDFPHTGPITLIPGCNAFVTRLTNTFTGMIFSMQFGGGSSYATAIAVDSNYNGYITGQTISGFPTTPEAFQPAKPSTGPTAFVAKLVPLGEISNATYLGGTNGSSDGLSIAVDEAGQILVAGMTSSTNFPGAPAITPNPTAGFLSKLTPQLNTLDYTTFLGAQISGVAVLHPSGIHTTLYSQIYTAGSRYTGGIDYQYLDAFVVKLSESPVVTTK
jgi:hypothetical protein